MRGWLLVCWFALVGVAAAQPPPVTEVKPVAEAHVLKVQNLQLRTELLQRQVADLQRQVQEAGKALDAEWAALEPVLRSELKPDPTWVLDRQKGAFVPPPKKETTP